MFALVGGFLFAICLIFILNPSLDSYYSRNEIYWAAGFHGASTAMGFISRRSRMWPMKVAGWMILAFNGFIAANSIYDLITDWHHISSYWMGWGTYGS